MSPEIPNASNKQLGVALKVGMIITHQKTKLLDDFNGGTTVVILDAVRLMTKVMISQMLSVSMYRYILNRAAQYCFTIDITMCSCAVVIL